MKPWISELIPDKDIVNTICSMRNINEIRLSVGQPIFVRTDKGEYRIGNPFTPEQIRGVVLAACRQSVYAHSETICKGYLTLEGGHRMGICGSGVVRDGVVQNLIHPTSLTLRIAKEIPGIADALCRCDDSLLIVGPPGCGKTTLLRDVVRQLSDVRKNRVGLADERGELSAVVNGNPGFDVGCRTDILVQIPKAEAVMMLLRTMNPQWIAMDEITSQQDIRAIQSASYCGVKLAATAHAESMDDLRRRPLYRDVMESSIFTYIVLVKTNHEFEICEVPQ